MLYYIVYLSSCLPITMWTSSSEQWCRVVAHSYITWFHGEVLEVRFLYTSDQWGDLDLRSEDVMSEARLEHGESRRWLWLVTGVDDVLRWSKKQFGLVNCYRSSDWSTALNRCLCNARPAVHALHSKRQLRTSWVIWLFGIPCERMKQQKDRLGPLLTLHKSKLHYTIYLIYTSTISVEFPVLSPLLSS